MRPLFELILQAQPDRFGEIPLMIEPDDLVVQVEDIGILRVLRAYRFEDEAKVFQSRAGILFQVMRGRLEPQAGVPAHLRVVGEEVGQDHDVPFLPDDVQVAVLVRASEDDGVARPVREQELPLTPKAAEPVFLDHGDDVLHGRALSHDLVREIAAVGFFLWPELQADLGGRGPVETQPPVVHPPLRPAVVIAEIHVAESTVLRRNEPDIGPLVAEILVVAEIRDPFERRHEERAGEQHRAAQKQRRGGHQEGAEFLRGIVWLLIHSYMPDYSTYEAPCLRFSILNPPNENSANSVRLRSSGMFA